eukprot:gb/GEZN01000036.1/.p1 GENE.gb/GEZN01000036.1/~~gb/GEZN01000036.1/.p1  ORF type:complete len:3488 (+),score=878.70 gb/GEZN01000036.1/:82-10545(+)
MDDEVGVDLSELCKTHKVVWRRGVLGEPAMPCLEPKNTHVQQGLLVVHVKRATQLYKTSLLRKMDPFVKLTLGNVVHKTAIHAGGESSPWWNQTFIFEVSERNWDLDLTLKVFDKTPVVKSMIGQAVLPCRLLASIYTTRGSDPEQKALPFSLPRAPGKSYMQLQKSPADQLYERRGEWVILGREHNLQQLSGHIFMDFQFFSRTEEIPTYLLSLQAGQCQSLHSSRASLPVVVSGKVEPAEIEARQLSRSTTSRIRGLSATNSFSNGKEKSNNQEPSKESSFLKRRAKRASLPSLTHLNLTASASASCSRNHSPKMGTGDRTFPSWSHQSPKLTERRLEDVNSPKLAERRLDERHSAVSSPIHGDERGSLSDLRQSAPALFPLPDISPTMEKRQSSGSSIDAALQSLNQAQVTWSEMEHEQDKSALSGKPVHRVSKYKELRHHNDIDEDKEDEEYSDSPSEPSTPAMTRDNSDINLPNTLSAISSSSSSRRSKTKKTNKKRFSIFRNRLSAMDLRHSLSQDLSSLPPPPPNAVFGGALSLNVGSNERRVPDVCFNCISFLKEQGLQAEGLFRVPGHSGLVKKIREKYDAREDPPPLLEDVHATASLLKLYLRLLPEPLIPFALSESFVSVEESKPLEEGIVAQAAAYRELMNQLPEPNRDLLRFLCEFLSELASYASMNRMDPNNIGVVFAPNIFRVPDDADRGKAMRSLQLGIKCFASMVTLFPIIYREEKQKPKSRRILLWEDDLTEEEESGGDVSPLKGSGPPSDAEGGRSVFAQSFKKATSSNSQGSHIVLAKLDISTGVGLTLNNDRNPSPPTPEPESPTSFIRVSPSHTEPLIIPPSSRSASPRSTCKTPHGDGALGMNSFPNSSLCSSAAAATTTSTTTTSSSSSSSPSSSSPFLSSSSSRPRRRSYSSSSGSPLLKVFSPDTLAPPPAMSLPPPQDHTPIPSADSQDLHKHLNTHLSLPSRLSPASLLSTPHSLPAGVSSSQPLPAGSARKRLQMGEQPAESELKVGLMRADSSNSAAEIQRPDKHEKQEEQTSAIVSSSSSKPASRSNNLSRPSSRKNSCSQPSSRRNSLSKDKGAVNDAVTKPPLIRVTTPDTLTLPRGDIPAPVDHAPHSISSTDAHLHPQKPIIPVTPSNMFSPTTTNSLSLGSLASSVAGPPAQELRSPSHSEPIARPNAKHERRGERGFSSQSEKGVGGLTHNNCSKCKGFQRKAMEASQGFKALIQRQNSEIASLHTSLRKRETEVAKTMSALERRNREVSLLKDQLSVLSYPTHVGSSVLELDGHAKQDQAHKFEGEEAAKKARAENLELRKELATLEKQLNEATAKAKQEHHQQQQVHATLQLGHQELQQQLQQALQQREQHIAELQLQQQQLQQKEQIEQQQQEIQQLRNQLQEREQKKQPPQKQTEEKELNEKRELNEKDQQIQQQLERIEGLQKQLNEFKQKQDQVAQADVALAGKPSRSRPGLPGRPPMPGGTRQRSTGSPPPSAFGGRPGTLPPPSFGSQQLPPVTPVLPSAFPAPPLSLNPAASATYSLRDPSFPLPMPPLPATASPGRAPSSPPPMPSSAAVSSPERPPMPSLAAVSSPEREAALPGQLSLSPNSLQNNATSANEDGGLGEARYWRVIWPHGVRVRAQPSKKAKLVGSFLKYGEIIEEVPSASESVNHIEGEKDEWLRHTRGWTQRTYKDNLLLVRNEGLSHTPHLRTVTYEGGLFVRARPDDSAPPLGKLKRGHTVEELKREGVKYFRHAQGWSLHSHEGKALLEPAKAGALVMEMEVTEASNSGGCWYCISAPCVLLAVLLMLTGLLGGIFALGETGYTPPNWFCLSLTERGLGEFGTDLFYCPTPQKEKPAIYTKGDDVTKVWEFEKQQKQKKQKQSQGRVTHDHSHDHSHDHNHDHSHDHGASAQQGIKKHKQTQQTQEMSVHTTNMNPADEIIVQVEVTAAQNGGLTQLHAHQDGHGSNGHKHDHGHGSHAQPQQNLSGQGSSMVFGGAASYADATYCSKWGEEKYTETEMVEEQWEELVMVEKEVDVEVEVEVEKILPTEVEVDVWEVVEVEEDVWVPKNSVEEEEVWRANSDSLLTMPHHEREGRRNQYEEPREEGMWEREPRQDGRLYNLEERLEQGFSSGHADTAAANQEAKSNREERQNQVEEGQVAGLDGSSLQKHEREAEGLLEVAKERAGGREQAEAESGSREMESGNEASSADAKHVTILMLPEQDKQKQINEVPQEEKEEGEQAREEAQTASGEEQEIEKDEVGAAAKDEEKSEIIKHAVEKNEIAKDAEGQTTKHEEVAAATDTATESEIGGEITKSAMEEAVVTNSAKEEEEEEAATAKEEKEAVIRKDEEDTPVVAKHAMEAGGTAKDAAEESEIAKHQVQQEEVAPVAAKQQEEDAGELQEEEAGKKQGKEKEEEEAGENQEQEAAAVEDAEEIPVVVEAPVTEHAEQLLAAAGEPEEAEAAAGEHLEAEAAEQGVAAAGEQQEAAEQGVAAAGEQQEAAEQGVAAAGESEEVGAAAAEHAEQGVAAGEHAEEEAVAAKHQEEEKAAVVAKRGGEEVELSNTAKDEDDQAAVAEHPQQVVVVGQTAAVEYKEEVVVVGNTANLEDEVVAKIEKHEDEVAVVSEDETEVAASANTEHTSGGREQMVKEEATEEEAVGQQADAKRDGGQEEQGAVTANGTPESNEQGATTAEGKPEVLIAEGTTVADSEGDSQKEAQEVSEQKETEGRPELGKEQEAGAEAQEHGQARQQEDAESPARPTSPTADDVEEPVSATASREPDHQVSVGEERGHDREWQDREAATDPETTQAIATSENVQKQEAEWKESEERGQVVPEERREGASEEPGESRPGKQEKGEQKTAKPENIPEALQRRRASEEEQLERVRRQGEVHSGDTAVEEEAEEQKQPHSDPEPDLDSKPVVEEEGEEQKQPNPDPEPDLDSKPAVEEEGEEQKQPNPNPEPDLDSKPHAQEPSAASRPQTAEGTVRLHIPAEAVTGTGGAFRGGPARRLLSVQLEEDGQDGPGFGANAPILRRPPQPMHRQQPPPAEQPVAGEQRSYPSPWQQQQQRWREAAARQEEEAGGRSRDLPVWQAAARRGGKRQEPAADVADRQPTQGGGQARGWPEEMQGLRLDKVEGRQLPEQTWPDRMEGARRQVMPAQQELGPEGMVKTTVKRKVRRLVKKVEVHMLPRTVKEIQLRKEMRMVPEKQIHTKRVPKKVSKTRRVCLSPGSAGSAGQLPAVVDAGVGSDMLPSMASLSKQCPPCSLSPNLSNNDCPACPPCQGGGAGHEEELQQLRDNCQQLLKANGQAQDREAVSLPTWTHASVQAFHFGDSSNLTQLLAYYLLHPTELRVADDGSTQRRDQGAFSNLLHQGRHLWSHVSAFCYFFFQPSFFHPASFHTWPLFKKSVVIIATAFCDAAVFCALVPTSRLMTCVVALGWAGLAALCFTQIEVLAGMFACNSLLALVCVVKPNVIEPSSLKVFTFRIG